MTAVASPPLREVQRILWRLLVAPEGAARGVEELRREGVLESEDLSFLVRSDGRLSAVERLDVYADMYFYRLRDCLAEDFPTLRAVLGPAPFHNLVTDYLLAHPSTHFSLRWLGQELPGFLAGHPPSRERAAIADLARLEWARADVFDAADAPPLARSRLVEQASRAPDRFAFHPVPATRLIRVDPSVLAVWKRIHDGGAPKPADCRSRTEPRPVLVWRKGRSIHHRGLAEDEARCLEAGLASRLGVARVAELLVEARPGAPAEQMPQRLAELLERWCDDELLEETS